MTTRKEEMVAQRRKAATEVYIYEGKSARTYARTHTRTKMSMFVSNAYDSLKGRCCFAATLPDSRDWLCLLQADSCSFLTPNECPKPIPHGTCYRTVERACLECYSKNTFATTTIEPPCCRTLTVYQPGDDIGACVSRALQRPVLCG